MELAVFLVAGGAALVGALGVVLRANTVHCALSLVLTLFSIAVLFLAQEAHFLAAVQVIVYAGAIVVLFLFVIMLMGVDRTEDLRVERLPGQRVAAAVAGLAVLGLVGAAVLPAGGDAITGARSTTERLLGGDGNVVVLARSIFGDHVFAFELTSALLAIAVVAAVLLVRRPPRATRPGETDADADDAVGGR